MLRPAPRRRTLSATRAGILRWTTALALSALLCWTLWSLRPTSLTAPIDVVGYPSFADYSYQWLFWAWRISVWVFPLLAFVAYLGLGRLSPWRRRSPARPVAVSGPGPGVDDEAVVVPILVPALLVTYTVSCLPAVLDRGLTPLGLAAGVVFALVQVTVARVVSRVRDRSFGDALAAVSAPIGVVVAVTALYVASQRTMTIADGTSRDWPWLPWWLAGLGLVLGVAWVSTALRRGRPAARVERAVRLYGLGGVATFLVALSVPGPNIELQGFDDSQSVTGADLLTRGYSPWVDFQFIHGLWEDVLRSTLAFKVFEPSVWGGWAAMFVIVMPLFWTFLYLLVARLSPRKSLVPAMVPIMACTPFLIVSARWVALPIGFLLLAAALRRVTWTWTVLLTVFLFVEAILVPESTLQVAACALVLLLADIRRRPPGARWWRHLDLVRVFVVTGAALSVALVVLLAATGLLSGFLGYYASVGAGHNESGAVPPSLQAGLVYQLVVLVAIVVAVVCAFLWVAWRWKAGRPISPIHWTLLAAALTAGAYGEKALGRFDDSHVQQSLTVAMPLFLLWFVLVARAVDARVRRSIDASPSESPAVRRTLAAVGQPAVWFFLLFVVAAFPQAFSHAATAAANTKTDVGDSVYVPKIGYIQDDQWDPALVADLDQILDTYAGQDGTVFDFTNAPGYIYFYLGRDMPTPMVHISLALTPAAQESVVEDLERSRPPVVIFDSAEIGYASWEDDIRPDVRHYGISQYVLDGWTPVLAAHETLFMLRNDLLADQPAPPALDGVADTTDLYFSQPVCDWGYAANYLGSEPDGEQVTLPVEQEGGRGVVALPPGLDLGSVQMVRFEAEREIGSAHVGISDVPADATVPGGRRTVTFSVLPSSGNAIDVRVGSCLQWHGFEGSKLYLTQEGGAPIERVTLSGVRAD